MERVNDGEALSEWRRVFQDIYGWPDFVLDPWREHFETVCFGEQAPLPCFLGRLNGEPVATSFACLSSGVVGIYGVDTIPGARRLGIGAAMIAAPLNDARALAYRIGILHANDMGLGLYRKMGFESYCEIPTFVWIGGASGTS